MDQQAPVRLTTSFELLAPRAEQLVERFYTRLFEAAPAARALFPADLTAQRRHLAAALALVARNAANLPGLAEPLREMGARHVRYGATAAHYPLVRDVLLATLAEQAGTGWSEQLAQDWRAALDVVAGFMLEGARRCETAA